MFVAQPKTTIDAAGPADQACEPVGVPEPFESLALSDVEREIGELAAHINAATCRWLLLAAEFERRAGHETYGFVSCASWLAWKCSLTPRAAREQLRVARCLRALPRIRAAFRSGRLSYSKARALTRIAEPEMEDALLELATETTAAQLERLLRGYRRTIASDAHAQAQERRHLSTQWEDDGTLTVRGNLPPEEGALLLKALELAREQLRGVAERNRCAADPQGEANVARAGSPGEPNPPDRAPDRVDALAALAEAAISHGVSAAKGGDRQQLVVHVDADALCSTDASAAASLEDRIAIPAETARRLGCDASIVTLVERAGKPLSVGRKTRSIPSAIQRALRARDCGCCFPGCDRDRYVDAHHVTHWAHGGETSLDNLVQLCRHHHRLVHEGGFSVSAGPTGGFVFRRPDGRVIEPVPVAPQGFLSRCLGTSCRSGAKVDQHTCSPRSAGERMDFGLAVFALAALDEQRVERE